MVQITLQIAVAVALAILAVRIQIGVCRRRNRDWNEILGKFRSGHGQLSRLWSLMEVNDQGQYSKSAHWEAIHGVRGLSRMYINIEVLVEAIEFVGEQQQSVPEVLERVREVRESAIKAQVVIAALALKRTAFPFYKPSVRFAVSEYLCTIVRVSSVVSYFSPELLRSYQYFVTRDGLRCISEMTRLSGE
jgi:hypothetical protein